MKMTCPCSQAPTPTSQYFRRGEVDFRRCLNCGLVYREQFPSPAELDEIYRQAYSVESIQGQRTDQESGSYATDAYAAFLRSRAVESQAQVLDFGAGTGALVEQLRKLGVKADGIEFSADARDYCLATRGIRLMSSIDEIRPESYDAVLMIEVVEHLTDLRGVLSRLRHVLKPGGTLFLTTPNRGGARALMEGGMWREACKKFHLFLFDGKSLQFHLDAVGLSAIDRVRYSPIQKPGLKQWFFGRATQTLGIAGTLCMTARK